MFLIKSPVGKSIITRLQSKTLISILEVINIQMIRIREIRVDIRIRVAIRIIIMSIEIIENSLNSMIINTIKIEYLKIKSHIIKHLLQSIDKFPTILQKISLLFLKRNSKAILMIIILINQIPIPIIINLKLKNTILLHS
jgi:hypothetical protein